MTQRIVSRDLYAHDLLGDLLLPEKLVDLCYSFVPELSSGMTICLTGYFACARGNIKQEKATTWQLSDQPAFYSIILDRFVAI